MFYLYLVYEKRTDKSCDWPSDGEWLHGGRLEAERMCNNIPGCTMFYKDGYSGDYKMCPVGSIVEDSSTGSTLYTRTGKYLIWIVIRRTIK